MSKHTSGPWKLETVKTQVGLCHKIGPFPSKGAHKETYACVYANDVHGYDGDHCAVGNELLANARLIAAAPDLLLALIQLTNEISGNWGMDEAGLREVLGNTNYQVTLEKMEAGRAVIAKAEGSSTKE